MERIFNVSGELGRLQRVLVHRPDVGIGLIPTHKTEEWLYDDIVDLGTMRREWDTFHQLLTVCLGGTSTGDEREKAVMDSQVLLETLIAENPDDARELIISLCTLEGVNFPRKDDLLAMLVHGQEDPTLITALVETLISGRLLYGSYQGEKPYRLPSGQERFIFAPIPNFIFTRDIGITLGDHILITQPKYTVRKREVWLFRFIVEHFLCGGDRSKRFSVGEDDHSFLLSGEEQQQKRVCYEGGDIMMISPRHVLIGWSERTTPEAIEKLVKQIFWLPILTDSESGIDTISVVKIGARRSQMHIDTVFTHIRPDTWALHAPLAEEWQAQQDEPRGETVEVFQYYLHDLGRAIKQSFAKETDSAKKAQWEAKFKRMDFQLRAVPDGAYQNTDCLYQRRPKGLQDLLQQISVREYGVEKPTQVRFVLSGQGQYPHDSREQWTDACNLVALRSGLVVGYDRNPVTIAHFGKTMAGEPGIGDEDFRGYIIEANTQRFASWEELGFPGLSGAALQHVVHGEDLLAYITKKELSASEAHALTQTLQNVLLLIPSSELSRARGGSHCMTLPLARG